MRRVLLIMVLGISLAFAVAPTPVRAGYCPVRGTTDCYSDQDLGSGAGLDPKMACAEKGGTYQPSGDCPAGSTTGSLQKNLSDCCFYAQGSCEPPNVSGQCPDLPGLPTAQHMGQACGGLPQCTGLARPPQVTATDTSPIRFKPQIPIPGSELFNGQEIIITGSTLGEYIAALYVFIVSAIGILAAVLVFYGGLKWLTSQGDRGRIQDAKEQISSALIGILMVFGAYLLLLAISPKLVKFSGLTLVTVPKREAAFEKEVAFGARAGGLGTTSIGGIANWLNAPTTGIKAQFGTIISPLASAQVPLDLIYAIIFVESGGRPSVISSAGACGIMQLLPATAGKTCTQLLDPTTGITDGVAYLNKLASDTCPQTATRRDGSVAQCKPPTVNPTGCSNGNLDYVIAAYNGGQGANCGSIDCPGKTWWECEKNPGYQETRDYYLKVLAAREALKPLLP